MVENFGSYLKHERELRGVPLEEISGATKIHIRYLKALEENSFDELPGEVFIKGYIRSYANTIGSDVEEMLNIYKESVELKKQEDNPITSSSFTQRYKTSLLYGLLILAGIGLLFGVGYLVKNGMEDLLEKPELKKVPSYENQAEVAEPSISSSLNLSKKKLDEVTINTSEVDIVEPEAPAQEQLVPSNLPGLSARKENAQEEIASPQIPVEVTVEESSILITDSNSPNPVEVEKPLKLLIRAKEISWFNMTIDNSREEDFILPAGTAKTFWGDETIRLTVGNKTGVELFLNGEVLVLPESEDRVVKDFFINSKLVE